MDSEIGKNFNKLRFRFSIIILVYNEESKLRALLNRLSNAYLLDKTEIIVIDSESTDNSLQVIDSYRSKIDHLSTYKVRKSDFNFGSTRNFGVQKSKGKYVCFISADALPLNVSFLRFFEDCFNIDKRVVAVFGKQMPYKKTPYINKLELFCRFSKLDRSTNINGRLIQSKKNLKTNPIKDLYLEYFISNVFSCYRKSFLLRNPFPAINGGEDFYIGKKIINKGLIKVYDKNNIVLHSHKYSIIDYYKKQKRACLVKSSYGYSSFYNNFISKIKYIILDAISLHKKIYYVILLLNIYLIKLISVIISRAHTIRKNNTTNN